MRLCHSGLGLDLEFRENIVNIITVENKKLYRDILSNLWCQTQGQEGVFILSEKEKLKSISKEAICLFNLFSMDCNDKKIINRVYQEIKSTALENLEGEIAEANTFIISFLENLVAQVPYHLDYDFELDVSNVLKIFNVRIDETADSLLEKLVNYIRVVHQICKINIFIFTNLKMFFTQEELELFYESMFYEKVNVISIEAQQSKKIECEKHLIIDKDLCIIEL